MNDLKTYRLFVKCNDLDDRVIAVNSELVIALSPHAAERRSAYRRVYDKWHGVQGLRSQEYVLGNLLLWAHRDPPVVATNDEEREALMQVQKEHEVVCIRVTGALASSAELHAAYRTARSFLWQLELPEFKGAQDLEQSEGDHARDVSIRADYRTAGGTLADRPLLEVITDYLRIVTGRAPVHK